LARKKKQQQLIESLKEVFEEIARLRKLPIGDFPAVSYYEKVLAQKDFSKFPSTNERLSGLLDEVLMRDLPSFMSMISPELLEAEPETELNPFDNDVEDDDSWGIPKDFQAEMRKSWNELSPTGEPLGGGQLKTVMVETKASKDDLKKIWTLADIERIGKLDEDCFILAMWLSKQSAQGTPPPASLNENLIPPSKRVDKGKLFAK